MKRSGILIGLMALWATLLWSQPSALLLPSNSSHFYGQDYAMNVRLLPADQGIQRIIFAILNKTERPEPNFQVYAADIPSVAAGFYTNGRLLIYNPMYLRDLVNKDGRINFEKMGVLAQQIGHHYHQHTFASTAKRHQEELEADQFAGYILSRFGASLMEADLCLEDYTLFQGNTYYPPKRQRAEALDFGWQHGLPPAPVLDPPVITRKASPAPSAVPSLAPGPDPGDEFDYRAASFPFPPPKASASQPLPSFYFSDRQTLAEVDVLLSASINACGYVEKSYFYVPDGFAMVTRLEQINEDATSKNLPDRWSPDLLPLRRFDLREYLQALFMGQSGKYRIFVFIVTPHPFMQSLESPSRSEAREWLIEGFNTLPRELGAFAFTPDHTVTTLIYEFAQQEGNPPYFVEQSVHTCQTHLERSRILRYLGNRP